MSLEGIYGDWRLYNDLVIGALRELSEDDLALKAPLADTTSSAGWPIWAIAGHTAAVRVYWLCAVLGVPGADETPFPDPAEGGWEDELDHPRTADELTLAWSTTWRIVERAIEAWTPSMLDEPAAAGPGDGAPHFTRRSLLLRLITHEAYHVGEIAVIQAIHGRPQIDLWPPRYHTLEGMATRASRTDT